jgi:hypothetical protein
MTSCQGKNVHENSMEINGGADEDRTRDLLNAIQALSQLSYSPTMEQITGKWRGFSTGFPALSTQFS